MGHAISGGQSVLIAATFVAAGLAAGTGPALAVAPGAALPSGVQQQSDVFKPDLVVSRFSYGSYVTVRNQGNAPAGASWVKVDAESFAPEYYRIPALNGGASYTVSLPHHDWCYGGTSLRTAARADVYGHVSEFSETNNRKAITEVC